MDKGVRQSGKWYYLTHTICGIVTLLQPLETIGGNLTQHLLSNHPLVTMCVIYWPYARLGGMALSNPTFVADVECSASSKVSNPLILP